MTEQEILQKAFDLVCEVLNTHAENVHGGRPEDFRGTHADRLAWTKTYWLKMAQGDEVFEHWIREQRAQRIHEALTEMIFGATQN